jgi:DNA-directed RNA polymerase omega subunit
MMIYPPIDELAAKMDGNKYKLVAVMAKRAKELEKRIPAELEKSDIKSVSWAAKEIADGKIIASDPE